MLFQNKIVTEVNTDTLKQAIFMSHTPESILYFPLINHPDITTFKDALCLIEQRREQLKNPYNHEFLCIHIEYDISRMNLGIAATTVDNIAKGFYEKCNGHAYALAMIYKGIYNVNQLCVILSDLEYSDETEEPVIKEPAELIDTINASCNIYITELRLSATYRFYGKEDSNTLSYSFVDHLSFRL